MTERFFSCQSPEVRTFEASSQCANYMAAHSVLLNICSASGLPRLFVDHQEITAFNGDDVTIRCHHSISGEIQWCRLGRSCVKEPSGSIDGTTVTINADFTVTMSGLRTESSGWYFCAKGELQMPVHVTVKERPSTSKYQTTDH